MNLVDTHCHIDVAAFDNDRAEVLSRCQVAGVARIVVPGIDAKGWDKLQQICAASASLYASFGLHPIYIEQHNQSDLNALEKRIRDDKPIAVGEIGLDFYHVELDKAQQRAYFEAQLAIAQAAELPVLLHVRKAHDAVLSALKKSPVRGGICHAFNGSLQQAHTYIDLGFKLGFGGMLTFERSHKLRRLAKQLPLDAIVLETDAPDMTVASHRGQRNSPEYLPECLAALASLRNEPIETIAQQTTTNAEAVLAFDKTQAPA